MLNPKTFIAGLVLVGGILLGWWLLSPLFHDDMVNEASPTSTETKDDMMNDEKMDDEMMDDQMDEKKDDMMDDQMNEENDEMKSESSDAMKDENMEKDQSTDEMMKDDMDSMMFEGTFQDGDSKHHATGKFMTVQADGKSYLRFEEFKVTNGPDLYVYLVQDGKKTKDGVSLGKLKGNVGNQNYELSNEIHLKDYQKVVIWCKSFDVDFGYAMIH